MEPVAAPVGPRMVSAKERAASVVPGGLNIRSGKFWANAGTVPRVVVKASQPDGQVGSTKNSPVMGVVEKAVAGLTQRAVSKLEVTPLAEAWMESAPRAAPV